MTTTSVLLRDGRNIGGIIPDVVIEESHSDTLTITDHPVEQGAAISDHAFLNPSQVTMRVAWSGSSLALNGAVSGLVNGTLLTSPIKSVRDLYEELLALQRSRKPFGVMTGKRQYDNMLIQSLQVTTDAASENALVCSVDLREVIIVQTKAAQLKPAAQATPAKTSPTTDRGVVQAVETDLDRLRRSGGIR